MAASDNSKKQWSNLPFGISEQIQKIQDSGMKAQINVVDPKLVKLVVKSIKSKLLINLLKRLNYKNYAQKREFVDFF